MVDLGGAGLLLLVGLRGLLVRWGGEGGSTGVERWLAHSGVKLVKIRGAQICNVGSSDTIQNSR